VVAFVAGVRPPARDSAEAGETTTMKLTTVTQMTIDGVTQGSSGASDEDRGNVFERNSWALSAGDNETRAFIDDTYQRAEAFRFGRRTYELFAGSGVRSTGCGRTPSVWPCGRRGTHIERCPLL
jgi:hypothetical protein